MTPRAACMCASVERTFRSGRSSASWEVKNMRLAPDAHAKEVKEVVKPKAAEPMEVTVSGNVSDGRARQL